MKLNHRIAVYVPSTFDGNKPARMMQRKATKKAARRLSALFGGATQTKALGYWVSSEKGLISERQNIVFSACTEQDKESKQEAVLTFARALCKWMKQEAVTVEIDGTMEFVEA